MEEVEQRSTRDPTENNEPIETRSFGERFDLLIQLRSDADVAMNPIYGRKNLRRPLDFGPN